MQDRSGHCLFLALGGQGIFAPLARFGGRTGQRIGTARSDQTFAQDAFRLGPCRFRLAPAAEEQHPLAAPQLFANFAVACRLPRLSGQCGDLLGQPFQHIIDAQKVLLGPVQFQLGLMAAGIQTTDPGRLFQNPPPRFRFGVDQFRDLALPHKGRAVAAGRGIGKQHLHIAGTHILGVDLVGAACVAGDSAHNFDRVRIVEAAGRKAILVVDHDADFGKMTRAACGGPGKDHILHPATAHRRRAVFAHDPAQRLQKIGLAAAIGANNTSQPLMDHQIRGVDKAFEAVKPEAVKTH